MVGVKGSIYINISLANFKTEICFCSDKSLLVQTKFIKTKNFNRDFLYTNIFLINFIYIILKYRTELNKKTIYNSY